MKKKYISKGLVLGNAWGGGVIGYKAETIKANSKKDLLKKAETMLKDGSLDAGFGFESLKGALLEIEKVTSINYKNKEYKRSEFETEIIGELSENEIELLEENLLYQ